MSKPRTLTDFEKYMDRQAIGYADRIRVEFKLPDPETYPGDVYHSAVRPRTECKVFELRYENLSPTKYEAIDFHIIAWRLCDGNVLRLWERLT